MFEMVLKNNNSYFDESYPQILTPPLNLKIWRRIPAPSVITHPSHPTISYREYRYFKQALENYRFCRNSRNDANGRDWGGEGGGERGVILFASLWRIAYENRYVTHSLANFYNNNIESDQIHTSPELNSFLNKVADTSTTSLVISTHFLIRL